MVDCLSFYFSRERNTILSSAQGHESNPQSGSWKLNAGSYIFQACVISAGTRFMAPPSYFYWSLLVICVCFSLKYTFIFFTFFFLWVICIYSAYLFLGVLYIFQTLIFSCLCMCGNFPLWICDLYL